MIIKENVKIGNKNFIKNYSDSGFYIIQNETGNKYSEAIDLPDKNFSYSESEERIEEENEQENNFTR